MLIPSCFYGTLKDIKKEMRKTARKLLAGKSLEEAFSAYQILDSDDYSESHFLSVIRCRDSVLQTIFIFHG